MMHIDSNLENASTVRFPPPKLLEYFGGTDKMARKEILSLPMSSYLEDEEIAYICENL